LKAGIQNLTYGVKGARRCRGFTLLELLIVVAIIAILISILMRATQALSQKARDRDAEVTKMALVNAIKSFRAEYGYWPSSDASPDSSVLSITAANQGSFVASYLLSTGAKNTRKVPFWDVAGVITNVSTKLPFSISINVLNETVTVN
jgi:prepilin-type N-terminal cleavage/methylation domain-containing protein